MKNMKFLALIFMCLLSVQSFAQEKKITELKNPTIKAFLMSLDGTDETGEKMIAKYGSTEVIENGMIPAGRVAKIISEDGNCVQFQCLWVIDEDDAEEGTEIMVYDICEKGGKIISFDLNFGDEDDEE